MPMKMLAASKFPGAKLTAVLLGFQLLCGAVSAADWRGLFVLFLYSRSFSAASHRACMRIDRLVFVLASGLAGGHSWSLDGVKERGGLLAVGNAQGAGL